MVREEHFQISTVARLTGLSVHNIRAWEKRYGVVTPERTDTRRRQFTREDVRRLTLLKALVDAGHPIGMIAGLTVEELESRLQESGGGFPVRAGAAGLTAAGELGKCRVLVVGDALLGLFEADARELEAFQVLGHFGDVVAAAAELPEGADLVLVDAPSLFAETVDAVRALLGRSGARRAILVYGFAQEETLKLLLEVAGITAIRGPIRAAELKLAALAELHVAASRAQARQTALFSRGGTGEVPPRRFTREQLARLSRITSAVQCECPQHLGNLLSSLNAFEQYSLECRNRSPEDAALHAYLHESAGRARAVLEEALCRVLEAEGIRI
jgi:DNA-binding transcriptional MerR regulator